MIPDQPTPSAVDLQIERIRAFIAVQLPAELRAQLAAVQKELGVSLPNVAWTRPEAMHLTLVFLGMIETSSLAGLSSELAAAVAGTSAFDLSVGDLGAFGDRVIWIGLRLGADKLATLAAKVRSAVQKLGVPVEERPFTGHVTLGRARRRERIARILARYRPQPDWRPWRVHAIELIRSELRSEGARYSTLATLYLTSDF